MTLSKENLNKINDFLWEIPRGFRSDMRVPARVYASEKTLEEIFRDRSLEQLVNVATLPGIQGYALVMPDAHEGYGFPIGGVAATEYPDGVISPGGIGYDINCLHPNSVINLPFGAHIRIGELTSGWPKFSVQLINKKLRLLTSERIINFQKRNENKFLYHIKTKFGSAIKVTDDHPIYTITGMKKSAELKVGNRVITYRFSGVRFSAPSSKEIISEKDVINTLPRFNLLNAGNRWSQIINWLKKRDLLPLSYNSRQLPVLIKTIGFLFGDGTANLVGKNRRGLASFYGQEKDLQILARELESIGISGRIYVRRRRHQIRTNYNKTYNFVATEHRFQIKSTALVILLYLLGAPLGDKTSQEFFIPSWLKQATPWQKRLFLASFFGAEMSKPKTMNKFNFYLPTLNINKTAPLYENGEKFLNEIRSILADFGIKSASVVEVAPNRTNGKKIELRFQVLGTNSNLIKFFETIGFEYNNEKQKLASLAIAYLKYKEKITSLRKITRALVRNRYLEGIPVSQLRTQFANAYTPPQFIEHSIWTAPTERLEPRIAFDFPSFTEFVKKYSFGDDGLVIDEVESIEREPYRGWVYDITVNHSDHNFIANNFVVSNCGVRLLKSEYNFQTIEPYLDALSKELFREIPSGVGRGGRLKLNVQELDKVLRNGVKQMIAQGYGTDEDLRHIESYGTLANADPNAVSSHAKGRGADQLGTMGAGNHFVEIDRIDEIFSQEAAKAFGLFKDQVVILVHTGSRGLGHQVATDYIRKMLAVMPKYGIKLPDQELACVPFSSPEGTAYFNAMAAAANFAWSNRQLITWEVRRAWEKVLSPSRGELKILYDVAHNIAKIEEHRLNGEKKKVIVHRKGATRAFGPGQPEIAEEYRAIGQPVLIPGSMGTASYVLVGTKGSMAQSFGSTCHGAGRRMSRHQAKRIVRGTELRDKLQKQGIRIQAGSMSGLAEEAPLAYKDVDNVVDVVHNAGIAQKVARLRPIAVIKG